MKISRAWPEQLPGTGPPMSPLCAIEAAEAEQRAVDEHRHDHAHVRRMRAAALIRMVDQERVAFGDVVAVGREHGAAAGRKRADMQRQHDMLGDHVALRVHQRAGGILRFAHDGGEAGAEQRVLHLLHDAGEARLDDFKIDGVDGHCPVSLCRHCERSEAIHAGSTASSLMDCFVASLLAMTHLLLLRHDQILPLIDARRLAGADHGGAVELIEDRRARATSSPTSSFSR